MAKYKILSDLLCTFMKIGLFTFGGGYAMLALIEDNCVEKKAWITHDEMMNITAVAESTPGPIAINCATFVGYQQAGLPGAIASTFGVVFPSFAIIFAISRFLGDFLSIPVIASGFKGIKIAVGILILNAAITMVEKMKKNPFPLSVMIGSFCAMFLINLFSLGISSICLIIAAAVLSLILTAAGLFPGKGGDKI